MLGSEGIRSMQTVSHYHIAGAEDQLEIFLDDPIFSLQRKSLLIQIFSSLADQGLVRSLVQRILSKIPDATIIGTSTSGEICQGKMVEEGILICASSFENTFLRTYQATVKDPYEAGIELANTLISPQTKCIIAFADGLMVNGEKVLQGFNSVNHNHIPIAGGMSGDGGRFVETYAFCGDNIQNNCVVGVALESDTLIVSQAYNLSWKAIGREMKVTDAEGNCVKEIDGRPVLDIYAEFLGEEVIANIPVSTIEFPLILDDDGIDVARSMVGKTDDNSVIFAGEVPQGSFVRFGVGSIQMIDQQRSKNLHDLSVNPSESIFVYSCTARKAFLGKTLEAEFLPLKKIAPVNGFFTYGEFYPSDHQSKLLNITTTILSLSENFSAFHRDIEIPHSTDSALTMNALLHLIDHAVSDVKMYEKENDQIRRSLEELQASINQVLIISRTDSKGYIKEVNSHFCKISGYSEAELLGKPHSIVRHPDNPKEIFNEMWSTIQSGNIWSGELRNRKKNGESYYVKSFIIPIHDMDGNIEEYLAIREDITGMIEAQESLLKEQAFLQAVMDSQDNIVMIVANSKIKKLSRKFYELFPFSDLKEFLSQHECICDLFMEKEGYLGKPEVDTPWFEDVILYPHRIHKAMMVDRWGRERIFAIKLRELYFDQTLFQIVTLNEITQIELAKVAADEAKNSRADFLAAMSHEIRTPMNGIIGFVELMKDTNLDLKQQKYIDIINSSSKTLLGIINEILDFSKVESGKMEIEYMPVHLEKEMENLFSLFEANASTKSIRYHLEFDKSIAPCLKIDMLRIKQILGNLIGNAIKFTPEQGEVALKISLSKRLPGLERILFSVHDTGIGIPKEKQSKIFEAFSQADSSTTREFGGTGLGLSISAKLVAMMGSSLGVESEVGKGSLFSFEIDCQLCEHDALSSNVKETAPTVQLPSNVQVLVAEDYEINQILINELLKRFDIVPDFVNNGSEAVDKVMEKQYDLVFMDVNMPVMDGIEATQFIRRNDITVPIVALTANAMEGDREKLLDSGMDDYLSKPVVFEEMQKVLNRFLDRSKKIDREEEGYCGRQNPIDYAQKELGLSREIVEKLFTHFFAKIDADIEMIARSFEENEYQTVVDVAHKIRGSAANMRLIHVAETAKALEKTPTDKMTTKGADHFHRLKKLLADAKSKAGY